MSSGMNSICRERLEAGLEEYKAGRRREAEARFVEALGAQPGEPTTLYLLGLVRVELKELAKAATAFEGVIAVRPRHAASWLTLAAIRSQLGVHGAAAQAYRRYVGLDPGHAGAWIALSQSLLVIGDAAGAMATGQSAVAVAPENVQTHLALASSLSKLGRLAEALDVYREAVVRDEVCAAGHLGLAATLLQLNRPEAALPSADRALTLDSKLPFGWLALGLALRGSGDPNSAILALERAIQLDPALAAGHAQLGCLYDEADRPLRAEQRLLDAVRLDPKDKISHLNLSSLYCRADQFELGRKHALLALELDPELAGAHQNLAGVYARQGQPALARRHRDIAYGACNLIASPAAHPVRRVLVLASADQANSPDRYLLPTHRYSRYIWFVEYAKEAQAQALPPHDVVFNAIGDHDSTLPTADNVAQFLSVTKRPVLNPPDKIARTPRHMAAQRLRGVPNLVVPATLRLTGAELARLGPRGALAASGLPTPMLVRPIGSHGGDGLTLLTDFDDAVAVEGAFSAACDHYLTAFRDFRSTDGLYRKYRMFLVDRQPYPYHLAIADHWLVHYRTSGTPDHSERLAEELRFLESPESVLGRAGLEAIRAIGQRLDLEFCGVDFSVLPDGRVLLFEANATMLAHLEASDGPLAYKNVYIDNILKAFWRVLEGAAPPIAA